MKTIFILFYFLFAFAYFSFSQNVGIGTSTPNASAMLDVQSTSKGLLPPRMTSLQRDAISSPTPGLIIFNTDTQSLEVFTNAGWFGIKKTNFAIEKLLGGFTREKSPFIQKTTDGGYIVAGMSQSSTSGDVTATNHGFFDYWVVKLDVSGNISWNKLLGGSNDDEPSCIQQTADGGYIVAGSTLSSASGDVTGTNHGVDFDYWIVKLDALGNIIWNKLLGGNDLDVLSGIQQTTDGGYIVAGTSASSANGDVSGTNHGITGTGDCWIIKLDAAGNITWNKLLGGSADDVATSIQQTTDGGYIVAGYSSSSASGNVTAANHGPSPSTDYWIIKLDAGGNITWNKLLGGNNNERANCIQQTTDGGYIAIGFSGSSANGNVTGTNHGSYDYWIVKLDASGNISWNKLLGGANTDEPKSIQQTTDGGYVIAGYSMSSANGDVSTTNHGNNDYWIVKTDGFGNITWNKLLGGSGNDQSYSILQTSNGNYIVSGDSDSSASGDVTTINHGLLDYWIVKLNAFGNIIRQ
jgi:hypothetical protein